MTSRVQFPYKRLRGMHLFYKTPKLHNERKYNLKFYATRTVPNFWKVSNYLKENENKSKHIFVSNDEKFDEKKLHLKVGDSVSEIRHITQEHLDEFSKLSGDHNPIHSMYREVPNSSSIVHGALLNGLVSGVIGTKLPGPGTVVISETLFFTNPCYAGEKVTVTVQITSVRKIITCKFNCTVQREKTEVTVLEGEAKLIFMKDLSKLSS